MSSTPQLLGNAPHATAVEKAMLGGLLIDQGRIADVAQIVSPEDPYHESHRAIYRAILGLSAAGGVVDAPALGMALRGELGDQAAAVEVCALFTVTPTAANVEQHAETIRRLARVRDVQAACAEYVRSTSEYPLTDDALPALGSVVTQAEGGLAGRRDVYAAYQADLEDRMRRYATGEKPKGVPTGFVRLDEALGGGLGEGLHILGGWSTMGKSAVLVSMLLSAIAAGARPRLYSLDMPGTEYVGRIVQRKACVGYGELKRGSLSPEQAARAVQVVDKLKAKGLAIIDDPMTVEQLVRDATRWAGTYGMLVIDTLQCLTTEDRKVRSEYDRLAVVMRELKRLKKRSHMPILILSQLNEPPGRRERDENKTPPKPDANEIKGGRVVTEDAASVILPWRASYGKPSGPTCQAEIRLGKHQSGRDATVPCLWDADRCEFVEVEE